MRATILLGDKPRYELTGAITRRLEGQFCVIDNPEDADVLLAVGGDGTMSWAAREYAHLGIPIYGINRGTVGFLLNDHDDDEDDIRSAVEKSVRTEFPLLQATVKFVDGSRKTVLAFNDVWTKAINVRGQGAKHQILIDGQDIMLGHKYDYYIGDGIIICTPGGSTAYNRSAGGIILDVQAGDCMGLTPICSYIPDNFQPQMLPGNSQVTIVMIEDDKRSHMVMADNRGFAKVHSVTVTIAPQRVTLLFAEESSYFMKTQRLRFPWQGN
jgi:NAD+ kinase